jgi:hypothetical protein
MQKLVRNIGIQEKRQFLCGKSAKIIQTDHPA